MNLERGEALVKAIKESSNFNMTGFQTCLFGHAREVARGQQGEEGWGYWSPEEWLAGWLEIDVDVARRMIYGIYWLRGERYLLGQVRKEHVVAKLEELLAEERERRQAEEEREGEMVEA